MASSKSTSEKTSAQAGTDERVLVLAAKDNVGTVIRDLAAGTSLTLRSAAVTVPQAIQLGHKIALRAIAKGEKIVKYGAPIGSATRPIAPGEHVHIQNIQSDYLPSFGRDGSNRMSKAH